MSELKRLKAATSLHDVAELLGFKPKALAFILYKQPIAAKYKQFTIPKRTGGVRTINAPFSELRKLQRRLSNVLQNCIFEINSDRRITSTLSHAFTRNYSILTNAANHRNRRYVFNSDLEDFFGTINFGRVRGFFIKNNYFSLHADVATVLAQIACHDNVLPQGSPCSPVISNLLGHLLDIRLAELAQKQGCTYSRYADDLTFSTNKSTFPPSVGKQTAGIDHAWEVGKDFNRIVKQAGFTINSKKTRMQYKISRQEVTGLLVNSKINTRPEYRHTARAMANCLFTTGKYYKNVTVKNPDGTLAVTKEEGTISELHGTLNFIDMVGVYNREKAQKVRDTLETKNRDPKAAVILTATEKVYQTFLFYKYFFAAESPVVVCEGKTDIVYLKAALRSLHANYPRLAEKQKDGKIKLKINFLRFTPTTDRLLGLGGGASKVGSLITDYAKNCKKIRAPGLASPVILFIDNDSGAKKSVYGIMKTVANKEKNDKEDYYFINNNLFVVATPPLPGKAETMIEHFFEPSVTSMKLKNKVFSWSNKFDIATQYGKHLFAEAIVSKNQTTINFDGFKLLLDRIDAVVKAYPA